VWGEVTPARPPVTCPDCGRSVAAGGKLCPHCGYPLMFEAQPAEAPVPGYLRKPQTVDATRESEARGTFMPPPQVVQQPQALGPHCPACGHRNGARRVRCEVCATELWPGAAFPARRPPFPPRPTTQVTRRRFRWGAVAFVAAALAAVVAVYFLAYALA
jgi:hypothetical protein